MLNGNIMCGGSVCGTAQWGEAPSKAPDLDPFDIGLLVAGGASFARGAVDVGEGLISGIGDLFESGAREAEPLGLRAAGAMEGKSLPALNRLSPKIQNDMAARGWTRQDILEVFEKGQPSGVVDRTAGFTPATQYLDPATGRFIVVNDTTGSVIQVSRAGFKPNPAIP
ncbi:MAG: colicin E5-related ribonuclease [Candidatus Dormibacteraceae bacterium]